MRRRTSSKQLGNFRSRRNFSNTPAARITLEDDDEDDGVPPPVINRRPRRPEDIRASKEDLRQIIAARKKPKWRTVFTPLDRIEIRKTEQKVLLMTPASQFVREFVDIKYRFFDSLVSKYYEFNRRLGMQYCRAFYATIAWLEAEVMQIHHENRLIEHEYCKIRFAESPKVKERFDILARRSSELQYEALKGIVGTSKASIRDLANLVREDYLHPQKYARARIDSLLVYSERTQQEYLKLQNKGFAVVNGGNDIRSLLLSLANLVIPGGPDYLALSHATRAHNLAVSQTAHYHRGLFLESRELRHPLKAANFHRIAYDIRIAPLDSSWDVVKAMLFKKPMKRVFQRDQKSAAIALEAQYMKWRRVSKTTKYSPENKYLRQLDVMAPFDTLMIMHRQLVNEVWYLIGSLQRNFGPMWDGIPYPRAMFISQEIFEWATTYRAQQKDFLSHIRMYRYINWIRLRVEEKLQKLDLPNTMQEQGLFIVPNPLSQDFNRFQYYIRSNASLSFEAWFMGKVLATTRIDQKGVTERIWVQTMKMLREREKLIMPPVVQDLGSETVAAVLKKRRRRRARSASKTVARGHDKTSAQAQIPFSSELGQMNQKVPSGTAMSRLMNSFWLQQGATPEELASTKISFDASFPDPDNQSAASTSPASDRKSANSVKKPSLANSTWSKSDSPLTDKRGVPKEKPSVTIKADQATAGSSPKSKKKAMVAELQATVKQLQAQVERLEAKEEPSPPPIAPKLTVGRRTFRSHLRRGARRSYCTDSRISHVNARDCSHESLPDKSSAIHVPSATKIADDATWPREDETFLDQTTSSELNGKANEEVTPTFWSHSDQRAPNGQKLIIHYCRSLESTEEVAKHFLNSKVIGFDMEWKAQAFASDSIQNNLSLIQIANEERIALFQIALFKPARTLEDFVSPSLRRILESRNTTKVGVAIKADSTRLRKYLGIGAQSIFELSHLFKLIKHGQVNPKLVNKRSVNLSEQVQEHFGLPLEKSEDVRCSDWTRSLNYRQVQCEYNTYLPFFIYLLTCLDRCRHGSLRLSLLIQRHGTEETIHGPCPASSCACRAEPTYRCPQRRSGEKRRQGIRSF